MQDSSSFNERVPDMLVYDFDVFPKSKNHACSVRRLNNIHLVSYFGFLAFSWAVNWCVSVTDRSAGARVLAKSAAAVAVKLQAVHGPQELVILWSMLTSLQLSVCSFSSFVTISQYSVRDGVNFIYFILIYNAPYVRQLSAESQARVVFLGGHPSKY